MPHNPVSRTFARMFFYGVVYGSLTCGFLFMTLILITDIPDLSYSGLIAGFIYGLPVGAFFGRIAGIFCGLAIMILIDVFLPRPLTLKIVRLYRFSIGIATACMCGGVLLIPFVCLTCLSINKDDEIGLIFFIISIAIGVDASQRTVTKYVRDIDPRKQKVK